jgi:hypothetical protein
MARHSAGARAAGAGSATLPIGSLYSVAGTAPSLREVGIFNTTSTAVAIKLVRLDTATILMDHRLSAKPLTRIRAPRRSARILGIALHSERPSVPA